MSFWSSRIEGQEITGKPEDCFLPEFESIPNGSTAPAQIKSFKIMSKKIIKDGIEKDEDYYEIIWKITCGDFKGREVSQKIKAFDEKDSIAQRALNMLKLLYNLLDHKPSHSNVPTDDDHRVLIGKVLGIKIGEWQMPYKDKPGFMTGNNVTEIYKADSNFKTETGIKKELPTVTLSASSSSLESAFSRNPKLGVVDDIPW